MGFYCKNVCCSNDWSIDQYNQDNKILSYEQMISKYHQNEICKTQCFDCMVIVGETRIKNKHL